MDARLAPPAYSRRRHGPYRHGLNLSRDDKAYLETFTGWGKLGIWQNGKFERWLKGKYWLVKSDGSLDRRAAMNWYTREQVR